MQVKDFEAALNPGALDRPEYAGKFTFTLQRYQAAAAALSPMLVAMQRDRCSGLLHRAHLVPERLIGFADAELWVLIVGNDSEDRLEVELKNEAGEPQPWLAVDGGTKVVDTEQIASWSWNHIATLEVAIWTSASARASTLLAQYQRNRNVLTVQSEVASAMPATPYQRISTRFKTTSSVRLMIPQ